MQLIGLKMEVDEEEFHDDREGLSIAAGINEHLEQVGAVRQCHQAPESAFCEELSLTMQMLSGMP